MPIADIVLPRDAGSKIRTAGRLLAFDPTLSLGLLVHGASALLVDLTLVLTEETYVPPLKSLLVVLGDVQQLSEGVDPTSLPTSSSIPPLGILPSFDPTHALKVTLMREEESLDLELWSRAARAQSADLWDRVEEEQKRRAERRRAAEVEKQTETARGKGKGKGRVVG